MRSNHLIRLFTVVTIAALSACSDEGPVSGPGTLTAILMSPNGPEGAAFVVLVGEGVGEVTAVGNTEVFARADGSTTQIVLINQAGGALSFQVAVTDTLVRPQSVVQEVAGPDDELRPSLAGYSLEFRR